MRILFCDRLSSDWRRTFWGLNLDRLTFDRLIFSRLTFCGLTFSRLFVLGFGCLFCLRAGHAALVDSEQYEVLVHEIGLFFEQSHLRFLGFDVRFELLKVRGFVS